MAALQKAACCSRCRSFKLEISFEWGTTRISIRTLNILNIYIYSNGLDDNNYKKLCTEICR